MRKTYPQATDSDACAYAQLRRLCYDVRMFPLWETLLAALLGTVAGYACAILGGVGVSRRLKKRMDNLEIDIDSIHMKVSRETKRRAGLAAAESRAEERTDKQLQKEAAERLAKEGTPAKVPLVGAFPSMFNRG